MTDKEWAIKLVMDCGWFAQDAEVPFDDEDVERIAAALAAVRREEREKVAAWMIAHSFATGHGDTLHDLLKELSWQIFEMQIRKG